MAALREIEPQNDADCDTNYSDDNFDDKWPGCGVEDPSGDQK